VLALSCANSLVGSILDTAKGRLVRIYKCACGERSWLYDAE
jgi:hypothetical protein